MERDIFTSKSKLIVFLLMVIGFLGTGYGFLTTPKNLAEAKKIATEHHHGSEVADATHLEHYYHALKNRPWGALYTALLFFFLLTLGVLIFYAIQYAAQAGWSIILLRIMEGITSFLPFASLLMVIMLVLSVLHINHLFIWMDEDVVATDELLKGKASYLNTPFFLIRACVYLLGWNLYRYVTRRFSLKMDDFQDASDTSLFKKNFRISAGFLAFFIVSESAMVWDWIMSLEPHWFSTLYAWYVFASFFVAGIAVLTLFTIYLGYRGVLPNIKPAHIHDLGRFLFAMSIFWAYLWFSQFILIWYANIPEEATYFIARIQDYNVLFFGMVFLNLVCPLLLLMDRDAKRNPKRLLLVAVIVIIGHYLDFYVMIAPGLLGPHWTFGIVEISAVILFLGIFIYKVLSTISKSTVTITEHPLFEESKRYH